MFLKGNKAPSLRRRNTRQGWNGYSYRVANWDAADFGAAAFLFAPNVSNGSNPEVRRDARNVGYLGYTGRKSCGSGHWARSVCVVLLSGRQRAPYPAVSQVGQRIAQAARICGFLRRYKTALHQTRDDIRVEVGSRKAHAVTLPRAVSGLPLGPGEWGGRAGHFSLILPQL